MTMRGATAETVAETGAEAGAEATEVAVTAVTSRSGSQSAAQQQDAADKRRSHGALRAPSLLMRRLQLILVVVSSERRNISTMIRAASLGRSRWSVSGRGTLGG